MTTARIWPLLYLCMYKIVISIAILKTVVIKPNKSSFKPNFSVNVNNIKKESDTDT